MLGPKRQMPELVKTYCSWFNLDYAITYFYNVYGPREISNGAYSTLIAKYLSLIRSGKETLPVVKPGSQKRNFTHVDDIVEGLILVALNGHGDGYGIGNDQAFTVLEIVEILEKGAEWLPERKGNRMTAPVNTELTKKLGWKCRKDLATYLTEEIKV
jgi:UDP-glucose 4-epimerase